ncbi:hypothetical protein [Sphaerisporangium dianthi]|uniref:Methyl-accepting chemotaxis protein n=1 Tax=Sphaerisporangium dianthi TaxID=1436120 RepID=A0ABV9C9I0_9ACTN
MTDQELADELRQIAGHPFMEARSDQLCDLADAILGARQLLAVIPADAGSPSEPADGPFTGKAERWCEVDLFAAFAPEDTLIATGHSVEILTGRKKQRMSSGARATISSVLVFVPILTTWFGLKMATSAYGSALDAGGPEVARRPFLEMWQQGFDGRLFWLFKFDSIAACTLAVIAFLIVWTVYENTTGRRAEDRSEQELGRLRARLRGALTQATLMLNQVRLSSPTRFTGELTKAAGEIKKIGSTTRKMQQDLSKSLTQALESAEKVSESLVAGATGVQGAVERLDRHLTDINTACAEMIDSVRQTSTVISATGTKAEQAIVTAGEHLSMTVSKTSLEMGEAVGHEVAQSTRAVREVIAIMDGRVAALDTHIAALDARVEALGIHAGEFVNAASRIESAIDEAKVTVSVSTAKAAELFGQQMSDTLSITASEFRETFGSTGTDIRETLGNTSVDIRATLGNTSMEIREALGDWAASAGEHASRIEIASDVSGRSVTALEETRRVLGQLPAALDGVISSLPLKIKELTAGEFAELKDAINHLESTVHHATEVVSASASTAISVVPGSPGDSSDVLHEARDAPAAASKVPVGSWNGSGVASESLGEPR